MLPEINSIRKASTYISVFRGLNRTENAGFSRVARNASAYYTEFTDMKNMSGCDYPQLRTRKNRRTVDLSDADITITSNLLAADGQLIYVTNQNKLCIGGTLYPIIARYLYNRHTLTAYGNRVIIMPDRVFFDMETHTFSEIDFQSTTETVSSAELNSALFNERGYVEGKRTLNFKDFSIEKVMLDDSGKPCPVCYIYEKAAGLDNYFKQTNPSGQNEVADDIDPWQEEYYGHWNQIRIGETVEAQGESPSGVYLCTDIIRGSTHTINGETYTVKSNLRRFVRIDSTYVKISRKNSGVYTAPFAGVRKGDWVKLSGMTHSVQHQMVINYDSMNQRYNYWPDSFDWGNYLDVLNNNTFQVYYADEDCIVIKAAIDRSVPYTGPITVERVMPSVEDSMMLEVSNRLWACSSSHNEIYSCRQGDATNWQAYGDGISTDSYAATVGCEGVFTGIARQNDSVIFFKENWIIKLFGTKPSNYTLATYNVPGVAQGSQKSVVWINGVLYYLSHTGVCRYSPGGQPEVVSEQAFGSVRYRNGVAGRHRDLYYISAQRTDTGAWELLALDTVTGMWHKEDDTQMTDCVTYNNLLYFTDSENRLCCADENNNLLEAFEGSAPEEPFDWFAETANLYESDFGKKYISKIQLAVQMDEETEAAVYAQFHNGGAWYELRQLRFLTRRHSLIPVAVRRSDYLKLRIEGTGSIQISGMQINFARGTEKRWQY